MDIFSKAKRSEIMSKIKSKNTGPEKLIKKAMITGKIGGFVRGDKVFGRPDFIFPKSKLAVFVDGKFWHGYKYLKLKNKLTPYWKEKLSKNIKRDKIVNARLKKDGWNVVRFWDYEVKKDSERCIGIIKKMIN